VSTSRRYHGERELDSAVLDGRVGMDERDFEGTLVLEQLAAIGRVEDFFEAIDADDVERATRLMQKAKIDERTIAVVVKKMEDSDGEH
jgi:hypothetical protein